jgi:phenylacetate-CoA ligase
MIGPRKTLDAAWDVWRTNRGGVSAITARQQARLATLIEFARARSPFYAKLYNQLPTHINNLRDLPPVAKPELMANFDAWVTDSEVTKAGVDTFVADNTLVGHLYMGRYAVWTTSGTTGEPGIFVHDGDALAIYIALLMIRGFLAWMTPKHLGATLRRGGRTATVVATGGHFASTAVRELIRRLGLQSMDDAFSVLTPLPELVPALRDFQPAILATYPSALRLLMQEQVAGRLKIDPVLIGIGGEWLAPMDRVQAAKTFHCLVRDFYGASEFMGIAFDCGHGWLHVNADWAILEPVNEAYQPVPPGQIAHTVLLTNLANRVQPIIRYDLGDSIIVNPDPCSCGSPLPAIRVEGRHDEILPLNTTNGELIQLLPMALTTVIEETPGVRRFQVIQTAPATLGVRLEVTPGVDGPQVWETGARRLRDYLSTQGLSSVRVEMALEPPCRDPISGKFRQVWRDLEAVEHPRKCKEMQLGGKPQ